MEDEASKSEPRAKRAKIDKKGRFAALEKLKQLKGSKYKYEVSEMDSVYEVVDEKEYSKKVLQRQDDDWIVDDDGCGYVEDGREIFDDDLDDDSIISAGRNKKNPEKNSKRGRAGDRAGGEASGSGSKNLRSMLMNMPQKKAKTEVVKIEDDDILGGLMQELLSDSSAPSDNAGKRPQPLSPRSYLRSLNDSSRIQAQKFAEKQAKRSIVWNQEPIVIDNFDSQSQATQNDDVSSQTIEDFDSDDWAPSSVTMNGTSVTNIKMEEVEENNQDDLDVFDIPDDDVLQKMHLAQMKEASAVKAEKAQLKEASAVKVEKAQLKEASAVKVEKAQLKEASAVKEEKVSFSRPSFLSDLRGCAEGKAEVCLDTGVGKGLPLIKSDAGDEVLRMFWLDAFEEPTKQPGVVYLFGKVWAEASKAYLSCCVTVTNIDRCVYMLPREKRFNVGEGVGTDEEVLFVDLYNEFNTKIAEKHKILEFKSRRVERNYAFSIPGIPVRSEYMEIRYPATFCRLPSDLSGETFSHVFGTQTSSLERLLLERKMKGPCWIDVSNTQAVANPNSWCKLQVTCGKPGDVVVCPPPRQAPPPLVVTTLSVRTVVNPVKHAQEIVAVSCLTHTSFHIDRVPPQPPFQQQFCALSRPSDVPWPHGADAELGRYADTKVEKCDSERALLNFLLVKLQVIDPDLIVGHDLVGYYWDMIVAKCADLKVPNMSRLGRLKRSFGTSEYEKRRRLKEAHTGRLICDVKLSAKELIKSRSFDLETLCKDVLHMKEDDYQDLTDKDVRRMYSTCGDVISLVSATMQDAWYALRLMCELNVMPLALQITNIAGNTLSRTLMGGRSERNEFLLLHAFTEKGYIVPDKIYDDKKKGGAVPKDGDALEQKKGAGNRKKKPAYEGGLVLEPKKGFYDEFVLLMDFNSLYPSIIQEYNICFTTVTNKDGETILPDSGQALGVLPTEIRLLVESRREVKKLMSAPELAPELRLQYHIRQQALKLTANSMYGCLGFTHSRFYAQDLAAIITAKGREILLNTKDLVEKMNHEVIYGDTDSLMINTKCVDFEQVFKIGHKIKSEVNRLYRQVELEVDGVFRYLLLLKKKKYAAVVMTRLPSGALATTQELKGLDIVRRDWSQLAAQAGKFVLNQILCELSGDERVDRIHSHLAQLRADLEGGMVPSELLVISKQLTRPAGDYADSKNLAHVRVALRLNQITPNKIRQGDTVPYIVCLDGTDNPATQRAYHVTEVASNKDLKVDVQYYLAHQIHPVVSRLCEPIAGTNASRIADFLGLDPSKYVEAQRTITDDDDEVTLGENARLSAEERFKDCDKFTYLCKNEKCGSVISMDSAYRKEGNCFALEKCVNPACNVAPVQYLASIQNALTLALRSHVHKYYMKWMVCEDLYCGNRTRRLPLDFHRGHPKCNRCDKATLYKEYTSSQLYTQICYYQHIFDTSKVLGKSSGKPNLELDEAYTRVQEQIESTLRNSAYSLIDLHQLFSGITKLMKPTSVP